MDIWLYALGFILASFFWVVFFGAPYVPTLRRDRQDILRIRPLTKEDVFVDLGSGDGVVLRTAAPWCKRVIGVELSPWLVLVSRLLDRKYENTETVLASVWSYQLPADTTVVYTFFNGKDLPRIEARLQDHVNRHGKDIDFITFGFKVGERKPHKVLRAMHVYRFTPLQK